MTHDADKLIRQLSLVAYLMAEQRPVTARDVKNNVEGYANMGDEAFARRYYADRAELQGLGVPITSGRDEFTGEELYTLREEQYFLPPIDLNDQELSALLNCLGMLDGQFAYAEPLRLALQNLALGRHVSADPGSDSVRVNLLGSVYTPEIAQRLAKLELAISKQRTVRFSYRSLGGGERRERQINPYGLFELNSVWYVIGDDLEVPEEEPRRKTYRVSRMGSEIKFATRRERDFRIPADFDVNAYRDRLSWQLGDETEGEAVLWIAPDSTFVARRLYGRRSEITEHDDGSATLVTDYTDLEPLSQLVLQHLGQVRPVEPPELARMVEKDLKRIVRLHKGRPSHATPEPRREHLAPQSSARAQGPVAPERFALLQALLAFLLERCGDETSATVSSADIRERFRLSQDELEEHLDLLNLVNFGGGCYAVYCATDNGSVHVDKELYGDTFRRPARLSPLEAKALIRALDVVAPLIAAEAHTTLASVRDKVQASFGDYSMRDTPVTGPVAGRGVDRHRAQPGGARQAGDADPLPVPVERRVLRAGDRAAPAAPRRDRLVRRGLGSLQGGAAHVQGAVRRARRDHRPALRAAAGDAGSDERSGQRGRHGPHPLHRAHGRARAGAADVDRACGRGRRGRHGTLRLGALAALQGAVAPRPGRGARPRLAARGRSRPGRVAAHDGRARARSRLTFASATRALRWRWRPSRSGT